MHAQSNVCGPPFMLFMHAHKARKAGRPPAVFSALSCSAQWRGSTPRACQLIKLRLIHRRTLHFAADLGRGKGQGRGSQSWPKLPTLENTWTWCCGLCQRRLPQAGSTLCLPKASLCASHSNALEAGVGVRA